jgi:periplasmic divalent cation tolerance protein
MNAETGSVLVVLSTFPDADAARAAATALVGESLAACVNLLPGIQSIYRWEGLIESGIEVLAVIKTTAARYPALEARLRTLHSYQVPEILALPASDILPDYARWLHQSVTPPA